MVNYDKWDKLEISDDEEDTARRRATVTRLDAPSRVTFGGDVGKNVIEVARASAGEGATNEAVDVVTPGAAAAAATKSAPVRRASHGTDYARFDAIARHLSDDDEEAREYYEDEAWAQMRGENPARDDAAPEKELDADANERVFGRDARRGRESRSSEAMARSASVRDARTVVFSTNGGVEARAPGAERDVFPVAAADAASSSDEDPTRLMWSQTKEEVTLSVVVPPGTRASDVDVRCAPDRVEVAVTTRATTKTPRARAGEGDARVVFLSDAWTHPIDPEPRDDDDDDDVFGDWELCDWEPGGRRVVRVTARKKTVGGSLVHWWRSGVRSGEPVDVSAIAGRRAGASESARRVWDEATEAFKKKVRDRERITIDA